MCYLDDFLYKRPARDSDRHVLVTNQNTQPLIAPTGLRF